MSAIHDMNAFVRVAARGSFAAAGKDLTLTSSAVSKIVTRMEQRLQVQLLIRSTRRLTLTPEGEVYLLRCKEILLAVEAAESEIVTMGAPEKGCLRINAGTGIGRHQIAPLLPEFLALYPNISIEFGITDDRIDMQAENIDITFRAGELEDSSLVAIKMAMGQRVICASPAYLEKYGVPAKPSELKNHNCILMAGFSHLSRWPFEGTEGMDHIDVSGNFKTDSADLALDMALAGEGIVRLMDIQVADAVKTGRLVPLFKSEHVSNPVPFWALTLPGRNKITRIRTFLDFIGERFSKRSWSLV